MTTTFDPVVSPEHALCPDDREMALRHKAACKNYIYAMKKHGNTPKGRAAAERALFHARMAMHHADRAAEILRRSR